MKFVHCSDLHLGRRPIGGVGLYSQKRYEDYFSAFEHIIDISISECVDAMLIAGDMFDRREIQPEILSRTEVLLEKLKKAGIETIVIEGNHDAITFGREKESWLVYLKEKGFVKRPSYNIRKNIESNTIEYAFDPILVGECEIYGLGYPGSMVNDVIEKFAEYLEIKNKKDVVAMLHSAPSNSDFLPGLASFEALKKLEERVKYLACGHFHSYREYPNNNPFLFIPGSLEFWDLGESKQKKGAILFDTQSDNRRFIPSLSRRIVYIEIKLTNDKDYIYEFEKKYREANILKDEDIVIVELIILSDYTVDSDKLFDIANSISEPLKMDISFLRRSDADTISKGRKNNESVESVESRIIDEWEFFGVYSKEVRHTLVKLKDSFKNGNSEVFFDTFDNLLNNILDKESCK